VGPAVGGLVGAGELQEVGDELLEAHDLVVEQRHRRAGPLVERVAAAHQHRGGGRQRLQRRAQLVAHVGGEAAVGLGPALHLVDHPVERDREPVEVGVGVAGHPGREVAGGDAVGRLRHAGERHQRRRLAYEPRAAPASAVPRAARPSTVASTLRVRRSSSSVVTSK
jgi:hypothetical protein